ncbi:MAG: hypothetical protein KAV83_05380 [Desulfobacterales bacterium]|nr:hypothetical protein [Desulfobacterales bacterium]
MRRLEDPLDFGKLFAKMEEIYELKPRPRRWWKEILKGKRARFSCPG